MNNIKNIKIKKKNKLKKKKKRFLLNVASSNRRAKTPLGVMIQIGGIMS